ncbi:hypothetical protein NSS98_30790 [Paenibacillus sp. FSL E2-0274]|uniref:hypothetical protein n=1 Tax=Paenibacillus TaxID=44249 RepID=UPI00096C6927|nr:hypothetical protein [Paenibacillus odorifer]OMD12607.1 hypothetical protein BJP47_05145 [Paenibacillus odorifer]OME36245.1 hypothetical protein BSK63_03850 [Paenibacillus odorifer]
MSLTFTEKEKRAVVTLIEEHCDPYLSRFPYARYPNEPLEDWKLAFTDLPSIQPQTIKQALSWHFGGWQRKSLSSAHSKTLSLFIKAWSEFLQGRSFDPDQVFSFWQSQLSDWSRGFNGVAFLLHLMQPEHFELADHHRIQAMTEILQAIEHKESSRTFSYSLQGLEDYNAFFNAIYPKLPYDQLNRIKLERFLKAYGNRHAYKHVSTNYVTHEPTIRQFTWDECAAQHYDLGKITLRSNADVLFAALLLLLDNQPQGDNKLTIRQVIEYLPLGTAGICNAASYNYAMIAIFGGQRGRDYFCLDNATLEQAFTEQANQSTRDMKFHLRHANEMLTINPKYLKPTE